MKSIIILLLVLSTCANSKLDQNNPISTMENQNNTASNMKNSYPFEVLVSGPISDVKEAQIRVVKEQEGLNEIYNYLNQSRSPKLNTPKIDFSDSSLIALFMGEKNYGGYSISVDQIVEKDQELVVYVKETEPSGKFATAVITQPFCIVKIKKTDKPIKFEKV